MSTQAIEVPPEYVGMVKDLPSHEYHQLLSLGSTSIKTLSDPDISLFEAKYLMEKDEHKRTFDVGTLTHALILEGTLDHLVAEIPFENYRTKEAREMKQAAYDAGLIPINESEYESMLGDVWGMQAAIYHHDLARDLLTDHEPEVSLFWEQDGVPLKARIDALHQTERIAVDLKTIRSARPNEVRKQISNLGYYIQARDYLNGLKAVTGDEFEWYFVMVQSTEPYTVSVHQLTPEALDDAQIRIDHAIDRYKQAQQTGWTGYPEVFTQELTPWEAIKNEDLLDEGITV